MGGLALAIFTTGTAVAATGQLVNIVDPASGVGAKVDTNGRLLTEVSDGSGPLTVDGTVGVNGSVLVSDGRGPMTVDGTVGAVPTKPVAYLEARVAGSAANANRSGTGTFTLPAGKTFVIESVTAAVGLPQGQRPSQALFRCVSDAGTGRDQVVLLTYQATDSGADYFSATHNLRAYCAGPNARIVATVFRNSETSTMSFEMVLNGFVA